MIKSAARAFLMTSVILLTGLIAVFFAGDSASASPLAFSDKATRQLFQAVYANDLVSARNSVSNGADVEAKDRWGLTPTDIAIDRGNYGIAHYLVSIRNTRRKQETASIPPTSSEPPVAAAPAMPATASKPTASKPVKPGPGTGSGAAQLAALPAPSVPPAGKVEGPNPFDPSTPAPGSQLPGLSRAVQ